MSEALFERLVREELARRSGSWLLRVRRCLGAVDSSHVQLNGRQFVNFASNNYLGLTHHPCVLAAAELALRASGSGAAASPLISGYMPQHAAAESAIARWKGTEAAILLPSGYQAAHAAIDALARIASFHSPGVRFLCDKLCHASLLDAVAAPQGPMRIFPHNGLDKLARLLADAPTDQLQIVLTESIFSMDGDHADLAGLAELKRRYPFVLLLDEAHGSGVYGPAGAGYAAECGLACAVDVSIVTLSKAVGVAGGAVCASRAFCEAIVNWGRAYIYSTSIPPVIAAAATASIQVMADEPHRQQRVRMLASQVRSRLSEAGFNLPPGDSPIIPIILGSEEAALAAARSLQDQGLFVLAIRPPTVPRGTSRLRITLSCDHSDEEIERLIKAILLLGAKKQGVPEDSSGTP